MGKKPLHAAELLQKYLDGTATEAERGIVEDAYNQFPLAERPTLSTEEQLQELALIRTAIMRRTKSRKLPYYWAAAASIVIMLGIGTYFYIKDSTPKPQTAESILPVNKGITLTIGNGQTIPLNKGYTGKINDQATQQDSLLDYTAVQNKADNNTITNNSDRPFHIKLADGTEATLDIRSALTYPVAFTGSERKVHVSGQAYFKVQHHTKQPFRVVAKDQVIEDIGTAFNIDAYADVRTTLTEGAAKVTHKTQTILLKPGEQAYAENNRLTSAPADIEAVTAWMQDKMIFRKARLKTIMAEVARVYDVQIVWKDLVMERQFMFVFNRKEPLANVLNYFRQSSNIDFTLKDKTLTIFIKPKK